MLRRYSGIKPSHLWNRTSIRDFLYVLKRRLSAIENWEQRERCSLFQVVAIVVGSGLGFAYTLGRICPSKILGAIMPETCKSEKDQAEQKPEPKSTKKKCATKNIEPCPKKVEPKMKPCPKCD